MSSEKPKKKRLSLHEVVQKLCTDLPKDKPAQSNEDTEKQDDEKAEESQEMPVDEIPAPIITEERRPSMHRFHLAKSLVPPHSPAVSEASAGDIADEASSLEKDSVTEEETNKEVGPQKPLRCGVCDLRLYKSYRYISRTSAPNHLKNFFKPDVERFRVCKRCFSSKEKCRKNLALVLLKSHTEQMAHVKTPLGVTHNRSTRALHYVTRDLTNTWKRPYEDLICDETLDVDDSDSDDTYLVTCEPKQPKIYCNGVDRNTIEIKNVGVVTVVRPVSNHFQMYPNHYTIYGEFGDVKGKETSEDNAGDLGKIVPAVKSPEKTEEVQVIDDSVKNGELKNEINSINEKLTLLDHAYALPAKAAKPTKVQKLGDENKKPKLSKAVDFSKMTSLPPKPPAAANAAKPTAKREPGATETKEGGPVRTCGIVCSICHNKVTKSYSCYNKDNAPDKIKHLFSPDVKLMKVCRRCLPYKKPKVEEGDEPIPAKAKGKVMQSKLIKQKIKKAKKLKGTLKSVKGEIHTQTKTTSPTGKGVQKSAAQKSPAKKSKVVETTKIKKEVAVIVQSMKVPEVIAKDIKPVNTIANAFAIVGGKLVAKGLATPTKTDSLPASTPAKGSPLGSKPQPVITMTYKPAKVKHTPNNIPKNGAQIVLKNSEAESENSLMCSESLEDIDSLPSVDSGTQSMRSLIGIIRVKAKGKSEGGETKEIVKEKELPAVTGGTSDTAKEVQTNEKLQTDTVSTKTDTSSTNSDTALTKIDAASTTTDTASNKIDTTSTNTDTTSPNIDTASTKIDTASTNTDTTSPNIDTVPTKIDQVPTKIDKLSTKTDTMSMKTDTAPLKTNATSTTTNTILPKMDKLPTDTNVASPKTGGIADRITATKAEATTKAETPTKTAETERSPKTTETSEKMTKLETKEPQLISKPTARPTTPKPPMEAVRHSPRRDRSIIPPEKKKEAVTEAKVPPTSSIVTRKRQAVREPEAGGDVKEGEESDRPVKKKANRKGRQPRKAMDTEGDAAPCEDGADMEDLESGIEKVPVHSYSTRFTQSPVCCMCCKEKVVKSYRCVQLAGSPAHVKPLFTREGTNILRICRKCLGLPSRVKSFL